MFGFIKEHYIESEGVHALEQAGRKYRVAAIVEVKAPNAKPSQVKSEKIDDGSKPKDCNCEKIGGEAQCHNAQNCSRSRKRRSEQNGRHSSRNLSASTQTVVRLLHTGQGNGNLKNEDQLNHGCGREPLERSVSSEDCSS